MEIIYLANNIEELNKLKIDTISALFTIDGAKILNLARNKAHLGLYTLVNGIFVGC